MDTPVAERALGFFALDVGAIDEGTNVSRIEIFPGVGKYVHPTSGKFEITQADLDAWVADINSRGDQISVDFDHSFAHGVGSAAAGWFLKGSASIEGGKLYADVEWTPEGASAIREKKYRFISPEFAFKFRDAAGKLVNKPRLWAAALTNRPFFDQMQPVTVCDQGLGELLNPAALLDAADVELLDAIDDEAAKALLSSALASVDPTTAMRTRAFLLAAAAAQKKKDTEPDGDDQVADMTDYTCSSCGAEMTPGDTVCQSCGHNMADDSEDDDYDMAADADDVPGQPDDEPDADDQEVGHGTKSKAKGKSKKVLADGKKPYGDVSYADPGYQDDGKARYPVDTEEHAKAAWSYINQQGNASRYSAEQLTKIKNKIKAALAKFGVHTTASEEQGDEEMDMSVLAETLGLPKDASNEDILKAATDVAAERAAAKKLFETHRKTTSSGKGDQMDLAFIAEELGLTEDADDAAVLAAIRYARSAIELHDLNEEELDKLRADSKARAKLEERVRVIEAERRKDRVKRILEDGVRAGKVIPAEKPVLAKQFANNVDGLYELLASRPDHLFRVASIGTDAQEELHESLYGVAGEFESKHADSIDPNSAKVHMKALQILAEQGVREPTESQYTNALALAYDDPIFYG